MKKTHLFFDLDRTLWDFENNSKNALNKIYEAEQLNQYFEHFLEFLSLYKNINKKLWQAYSKHQITKNQLRDRRFIECFEKKNIKNEQLAKKISDLYIEISPQQTKLFPNTLETLSYLKKSNYTLHIITNGFEEVQFKKLKNSKLEDYFTNVICSEQVGFNKPDKRIFLHALNVAKTESNKAVMIGDDLKVDILGANQLGIETILFDPNNEYGTVFDTHKIQNLIELKKRF
ncbi:MAG: noncanonical pyrimidine nucleotidase, YjjG family [Flavobacteriia bacterium]|nr:noncanonical pyrimidine nucleotidase, YjjG family [Flavobacteriia bacterium]